MCLLLKGNHLYIFHAMHASHIVNYIAIVVVRCIDYKGNIKATVFALLDPDREVSIFHFLLQNCKDEIVSVLLLYVIPLLCMNIVNAIIHIYI